MEFLNCSLFFLDILSRSRGGGGGGSSRGVLGLLPYIQYIVLVFVFLNTFYIYIYIVYM